MDLSAIPLFDHHCHALRRSGAVLDGPALRRHFSESADPAMTPHLLHSLFYRRGLRDLAELLGCAPTEEALVAARQRIAPEDYAGQLITAANITVMAVDTGFRGAENYTLDEQRAFLPCTIYEVLRLETLAEELITATTSFAQLEDAYRAALTDLRSRGIVALKSIAAYRGGLQVQARSRAEAEAVYPALKEAVRRDGRVRLSSRPLLEYVLRIGLEAAAVQELPVQFHTGFGDADADLRSANPLHLRPLLQDEALRGMRFVLLHTYPYVREAGYLAGIYSHVYADLSLTIPFTAHGGVAAIRAALELAPTSKVLLATDAFSIPELFYLGALYAREGLAGALQQLQAEGWLIAAEVEAAAQQMLYGNAAELYGVER
ncbi:MAG: amidohydrolase family protein [Chloroflexales bacterium]|nr:amidohydrolase family protein [Chloroflexales bacterium]